MKHLERSVFTWTQKRGKKPQTLLHLSQQPNGAPVLISHTKSQTWSRQLMFRLASSHTQRKLSSAGKLLCEQKKPKTFSEMRLTYRWHRWRFWREPRILHTLKVPLRPFKHPWGLKVQSVTNWWAPNQPVHQVLLEDLKHTKTNKHKQ